MIFLLKQMNLFLGKDKRRCQERATFLTRSWGFRRKYLLMESIDIYGQISFECATFLYGTSLESILTYTISTIKLIVEDNLSRQNISQIVLVEI